MKEEEGELRREGWKGVHEGGGGAKEGRLERSQ